MNTFLTDILITKNITLSAKKANLSAAHGCDILKNKYWGDVPICEELYIEVKKIYPTFNHSVFK